MTVRFHREKRSWIILNFSSPAWTLICKSILMQLAVCSELYSASRDSSAWYSRAHSVGWCFQTSIWQARRDSARNDTWNIAWLARDRALQVAARLSTLQLPKSLGADVTNTKPTQAALSQHAALHASMSEDEYWKDRCLDYRAHYILPGLCTSEGGGEGASSRWNR